MTDLEIVRKEACELVNHVIKGLVQRYDGTWTCSVYDTAWVSMVQKPDGTWLLPQCFQYILHEQQHQGGWSSPGSEIDGILHTLAAVLAIETHVRDGNNLSQEDVQDLEQRKEYGVAFLQSCLERWNVGACLHVGFEILVPSLLTMLEAYGISFHFPGRSILLAMKAKKMKNFRPDYFYGPVQMTGLHSLEAFIGMVVFSRLRHHQVHGGILGSPSATAAYLMNVPQWNQDAADYLLRSARHGGGFDQGGVPSAFPCEIFEFTWVSTTFLHAGLLEGLTENESFAQALDKLASLLEENKGIVGFASGLLPDADDTAKAVHLLNLVGRSMSPAQMISHFISPKGHMMTYLGERNPSPSANCDALMCILDATDFEKYATTIESITRSLCECWWNDKITDKWNLSSSYTTMLLCQALTKLMRRWDAGALQHLSADLLHDNVMVVVFQLLNRILFASGFTDRCTNSPYAESVAYEVLACSSLVSLPFTAPILQRLEATIESGKAYITNAMKESDWESGQYLWIEKVTYGSKVLAKAYCLAALHATSGLTDWNEDLIKLFQPQLPSARKSSKFFQIVLDPDEPMWKYEACIMEGAAFTSRLRSYRTEIFPLRPGSKDACLQYIPATWTLINNFHRLHLPTSILWEMMKFSLLDFLVDEYMESSVALLESSDRNIIRKYVYEDLLSSTDPKARRNPKKRPFDDGTEQVKIDSPHGSDNSDPVDEACKTLARYVEEVMHNPSVETASPYDKYQVRTELRDFLMAHFVQIDDNAELIACCLKLSDNGSNNITLFSKPRSSFYTWARTTASQHISCPLSFAFYTCLLTSIREGKSKDDCFASPTQKYKAGDLCAHLAVMSRLFNDYASLRRDQQEGNLNSVNFPEFHPDIQATLSMKPSGMNQHETQDLKQCLLQLGEYERQASRSVMGSLVDEVRGTQESGTGAAKQDLVCRGLALFAYVTELYADMYVAKDLTNEAR